MTATAPEIMGCPELAVKQLLDYLTETRDNLSLVILRLTQQRNQLNARIAQAKTILANG